jgi:hypothetical protein
MTVIYSRKSTTLLSALVETKLNVGLHNGVIVTTEVMWYQCSEKMCVMKMVRRVICEIETYKFVGSWTHFSICCVKYKFSAWFILSGKNK